MAVEVRHVSEEELREKIARLKLALWKLDRWEDAYGSREDVEAELKTAHWLLTGEHGDGR